MQGLLPYQVPNDVGVLPLLETGAILHVLRDMVAAFIPANRNFFTLVETTAEDPSREQGDANVREGWKWASRVVSLMVLYEILLAIEYPVAAQHNTRPVFSRLMHPHLMLLPVRLGFECF
jgi:hypothetical protein